MTIKISPIKAFTDNYIWAIQCEGSTQVVLVDPGHAQTCIDYLTAHQLSLSAILITHHHPDHVGGVTELKDYGKKQGLEPNIYGPASESIPSIDVPLSETDSLQLTFDIEGQSSETLTLSVLDIPGHTSGHIAYVAKGFVFCGDTLFSGGCGRLFEGTPEQMHHSLAKLTALPQDTLVYCSHEYTLANLYFALAVEPNNLDLIQYFNKVNHLREANQITLPSSINQELAINPFLRCHEADVKEAAATYAEQSVETEVEVFAAIRRWKDNF